MINYILLGLSGISTFSSVILLFVGLKEIDQYREEIKQLRKENEYHKNFTQHCLDSCQCQFVKKHNESYQRLKSEFKKLGLRYE